MLLRMVVLRTGKTLHWNGLDITATDAPEAKPFIGGYCQKGWEN